MVVAGAVRGLVVRRVTADLVVGNLEPAAVAVGRRQGTSVGMPGVEAEYNTAGAVVAGGGTGELHFLEAVAAVHTHMRQAAVGE